MITYRTRAAAAATLALASLAVTAPAHASGEAPVDLLTLPAAVAGGDPEHRPRDW
ncbi:hypothetical protein [Streptomyces tanashiensis]|uniref:hypothetical protein n=1 Tax=Streptomyces tanashiensis TaxID=67367 RepID=UPI0016756458|nr:hypothetical protein [Streptomyces tanashiensis]